MSKYLELFAKALGMVEKDVKRSRYELETNKNSDAEDEGRQMGSTPEEPLSEEEAPKAEQEEIRNRMRYVFEDALTANHKCDSTCLERKGHLSTYIRGTGYDG